MPHYEVNARYVLFTYAQCGDLDPFEVSDHFTSLEAECIIGRESHEDGGTHLHVFVDFGRKFRTRRVDLFDVGGFHPNISASRGKPEEGYDYAIKEGDVVAGGLERPTPTGDRGSGIDWSILLSAGDRDECLRLARIHAPSLYWRSFNSLYAAATWYYTTPPEPYRHPEDFQFTLDEYPELDEWKQEHLFGNNVGECYLARHYGCSRRPFGASMPTTRPSGGTAQRLRSSAPFRNRNS